MGEKTLKRKVSILRRKYPLSEAVDLLKSGGYWQQFETRRNLILKQRGCDHEEARDSALLEFEPMLDGLKNGDTSKLPPAITQHGPSREHQMAVHQARGERNAAGLKRGASNMEEIDALMELDAEAVDQIRWVSKQLALDDITLCDYTTAPDASAVGMFKSYSRTVERQDEFWDKMYSKTVPSRAQLDVDQKVKVDGQDQIDACDRILEIAATAKLAKGETE